MTRTDQTTVLVTGGAGYVGCHCVLQLLENDYNVIVIDNCSNAHRDHVDANGNLVELPESLRRVEELTAKKLLAFYEFDLVEQNNQRLFDEIFHKHAVRVVLHFAAFKSVNESIERPLDYYNNNLVGTINLLNAMRRHGCKQMIFSSSATVYGLPQYLPVDERHQAGQNILNPYGRTKFMIEQMLMDLCNDKANDDGSSSRWNIISLRYFNPVGAHPSGYIGEHTQGIPNNLMPYVSQVSIKKRERLYVFGNDFDTPDGTGVRDFIHIMDLASGHLSALKYLLNHRPETNGGEPMKGSENNYKVYNLGTGKGYSVLEVIKTFEKVNNVQIPYEIAPRRQGDAGSVYADASLAYKELNWKAQYSIIEMVRDIYKWQSQFPDGFKSPPKESM